MLIAHWYFGYSAGIIPKDAFADGRSATTFYACGSACMYHNPSPALANIVNNKLCLRGHHIGHLVSWRYYTSFQIFVPSLK